MSDTSETPIASLSYCAAILLLGETLAQPAEQRHGIALACVGAAIILVALPLFLPRIYFKRTALDALIAVGIIVGFARLPLIDLFLRYPGSRRLLMPFVVLSVVAAVLSILVLLRRPRSMVGGVFALLLLDVGLMALFHLNLSGLPRVDVYEFQELSCDALLHGRNPFAMTFPDIYGPDSGYYRPGAVLNGRVQSGYDYPPLSLYLDLPGYIDGDLRLSHLVAVLGAAGLIGYSRRRFAPALWLLFTPRLLFILENAWIETYAVLLLALVVSLFNRRNRCIGAMAVGLLVVTKQYMLLTAPCAALLLPIPWRSRDVLRFALLALLGGSVVTLPFVLWNPMAFFHSMTTLYTNALRLDSISFLPAISRLVGTRLTLVCPLLAALPPTSLVLWRGERSPAGFAAAMALVCLCIFAFSTQAFINYYFFAVAALCAAVALEDPVTNLMTVTKAM